MPGDEPEDAKPEKAEKESKKAGVTQGEDEFGEFEETMNKGQKQMDQFANPMAKAQSKD